MRCSIVKTPVFLSRAFGLAVLVHFIILCPGANINAGKGIFSGLRPLTNPAAAGIIITNLKTAQTQ
jgi:hypothetical protein